jgi:2-keto-3-deoxy-L-arabinonate dehydratase
MVMLMPPYHGATIQPDESDIFDFYQGVAAALDIPIMIQDAPVSGVSLRLAIVHAPSRCTSAPCR